MVEPKQYPMTPEALENLRAELRELTEVKKPAMAARLKAAIEMGDLSENADYIMAKEEQGFLEGRINELQEMIRGAVIIETGNNRKGIITLGSRVTVQEEGEDDPETFMIVGKVEADPRQGKISEDSPLGKALMGRKAGDTIQIEAPVGTLHFKILTVS